MDRTNFSSLAALTLLTLACGGTVHIDEGAGGSGDPDPNGATSTTSGAAGGDGGEGGGPVDPVEPGLCERLSSVVIYDMEIIEESGDGVWSPGERATLRVTLWNYGAVPNSDYPGIVSYSGNPYVVHTMGASNYLFGLEAGAYATLDIEYQALDFVPIGESVFIDAQVTSLVEPCANGDYYYTFGYIDSPVEDDEPPVDDGEPPHGED